MEEAKEQRVCAVMCGNPTTDTCKFFPICPNGHFVHAECFQRMLESNENPCCPLCRDDTMSLLKDMIVKQPHMNQSVEDDTGLDAMLMIDSDDDSEFAETVTNANNRPAVLNFTGTIQNLTMVFLPGGVNATGFPHSPGELIPLSGNVSNVSGGPIFAEGAPHRVQVINHP